MHRWHAYHDMDERWSDEKIYILKYGIYTIAKVTKNRPRLVRVIHYIALMSHNKRLFIYSIDYLYFLNYEFPPGCSLRDMGFIIANK